MQSMIHDLGAACGQFVDAHGGRYFRWEPSSLEFIWGGRLLATPPDDLVITQAGHLLAHAETDRLELLGDLFDPHGTSLA
eukprot:1939962-Pyramimonas_sp.AAC.1